jgi:hypothetical protein
MAPAIIGLMTISLMTRQIKVWDQPLFQPQPFQILQILYSYYCRHLYRYHHCNYSPNKITPYYYSIMLSMQEH